jgi:hypothetical protein
MKKEIILGNFILLTLMVLSYLFFILCLIAQSSASLMQESQCLYSLHFIFRKSNYKEYKPFQTHRYYSPASYSFDSKFSLHEY